MLKKVEDNSNLKRAEEALRESEHRFHGVATFPHDAKNLNGLEAAADQALFAIKKSGNGGVGRFQDLASFQPGREKKKIPPNILPHLAMQPFSL